MAVIGMLSFSDGRPFVHRGIAELEDRIVAACQASGHRVIRASEPVTSNEVAMREARQMAVHRPDLTIFNCAVWAFPHFSVHTARATTGPLVPFSNIDPTYPGMVRLLAAGGSLDQLGRRHERLWGDVGDDAVRSKVGSLARVANVVRSLGEADFRADLGGPNGSTPRSLRRRVLVV